MQIKREIYDFEPLLKKIDLFISEYKKSINDIEKKDMFDEIFEVFFPEEPAILKENIYKFINLNDNDYYYNTKKSCKNEFIKKYISELQNNDQINESSLFLLDNTTYFINQFLEKISTTLFAEITSHHNVYKNQNKKNIFFDIDIKEKRIHDYPHSSLQIFFSLLTNAKEEDKESLKQQMKDNIQYLSEQLKKNDISLHQIEEVNFNSIHREENYKKAPMYQFLLKFKGIQDNHVMLEPFIKNHPEIKDIFEKVSITKEIFRNEVYESKKFAYVELLSNNHYHHIDAPYFIKLYNHGIFEGFFKDRASVFNPNEEIFYQVIGHAILQGDYQFITKFLNDLDIKDLSDCILMEHKNLFSYCQNKNDFHFLNSLKYPFFQVSENNIEHKEYVKNRLFNNIEINKNFEFCPVNIKSFTEFISNDENIAAIDFLKESKMINLNEDSYLIHSLMNNILNNKNLDFLINFEKITKYDVYQLNLSHKIKPKQNDEQDKKEIILENFKKTKRFNNYESFFESIQNFKEKTVSILKYLHKHKQIDLFDKKNLNHIFLHANKNVTEMMDNFFSKGLLTKEMLLENMNGNPLVWHIDIQNSNDLKTFFSKIIKENSSILYNQDGKSYLYQTIEKRNIDTANTIKKLNIQNKLDFSYVGNQGNIYHLLIEASSKGLLSIDNFKSIINLDADPLKSLLQKNHQEKSVLEILNKTNKANASHILKAFLDQFDLSDKRLQNCEPLLEKLLNENVYLYKDIRPEIEKNSFKPVYFEKNVQETIFNSLSSKPYENYDSIVTLSNNINEVFLYEKNSVSILQLCIKNESLFKKFIKNLDINDPYLYQTNIYHEKKPNYEIMLETIENFSLKNFNEGHKLKIKDMSLSLNELFSIMTEKYINKSMILDGDLSFKHKIKI